MNKTLLLLAAAAAATPAFGAIKAPVIYDNASFNCISANGQYAVSEIYGTLVVYNLKDNSETAYEADDTHYYGVGHGRCMTADGNIIIGNTTEACDAAYCEAGEWKQLNVPDPEKTNLSNAVTPDGKRICGTIGNHQMTISEDVLMEAPVYWDRQEDGTYGEYHLLPYPEKDFFGETPQYVTAINLSDDGKVIVGLVTDCSGAMLYPIVYTQADNGEWSYSLPTKDLFNPDNLPAAVKPGDGPMRPSEEQFMTEEELAAYNTALQAYYDSGYNQELYPKYENYMTEEEKAAFDEAYAAWETEQAAWQEQSDAWYEYFDQVLASSPSFVFNNIMVSPDGKTIASTLIETKETDDPLVWPPFFEVYIPATIDIATGALTKHESEKSIAVSCMAADGTIMAATEQGSIPSEGFIIKDGTITPLTDYLNAISPEYGVWLKENMTHEVMTDYVYDEDLEDYVEVYEEVTFTGIPVATPDMKVLAFWNDCPWDMMGFAQSVVIDLTEEAGISAVEADKAAKVAIDADGNLTVGANVVSVTVYDLAGATVASVENPAGIVALGLNSGVYVVKATLSDGTAEVAKVAK